MNANTSSFYGIILFDGVCNLCTGAVQFILKRDPKNRFRFAALQSKKGQQLVQKYQLTNEPYAWSIVLVTNEDVYTKSTAALHITKKLSGSWPVFWLFILCPKFIRDGLYNFIAKNRYKWFKKRNVCWVPSEKTKALFYE